MRIKVRIIQLSIIILNCALSVLYFFLKLFPARNGKVLFCSRQSNEPPLDFLMIKDVINKKRPDTKFIMICSRLDHSAKGCILFFVQLLRSMYHLATSNICIIDSYWPAVSMLKHKKSLKVIQIWHSIGKMKKSGYQSLGKKSGRKPEFAGYLKMHKNYDYFIGGAPVWNKYYAEAFNIDESRILNYGLPRIDYLIKTQDSNRAKFFEEFPGLIGKKIVLYAPTFRKKMKSHWQDILRASKYDDIIIIVKNHPGQIMGTNKKSKNIYYMDKWQTIDLIAVCDYMITDYSSIALEAAVLKKRTMFWTYDFDEYMENSGINIDLKKEMPGNMSDNIDEIMYRIENDIFDEEQQEQYIEKYLPAEMGKSTERIAGLAIELMPGWQADTAEDQENGRDEVRDNGRRQRKPLEAPFGGFQAFSGSGRRASDMQDDKVAAYSDIGEMGDNRNIS